MLYNNFDLIQKMTLSQSKLMMQLAKQAKVVSRNSFSEEALEDVYHTICKLEPKNLMLVEFLVMCIEKELIRNSIKLGYLVDLFEETKGKNVDQDYNHKPNTEEQKFSKKKFLKLLKDFAKKLYPGLPNAYETTLFDRLTMMDAEDHRIRIDDSMKKYLTRQVVEVLTSHEHELQMLFTVFMPENYNSNLSFNWEEVKLLEKRLPIICVMRLLWECEVLPHFITASQFLETFAKLKPPSLPNNSGKEAMFYTLDSMQTYIREHLSHRTIKLLEGDIGVSFLEFQLLLVRFATDFCKDSKSDFVGSLRKFFTFCRLKQIFNAQAEPISKMENTVKRYRRSQKVAKVESIEEEISSIKNIEQLYDCRDEQIKEEENRNIYKSMSISDKDLQAFVRDLSLELPETLARKVVDKENDGFFDVEQKYVVIGDQLPKIQEKNKASTQKDTKKKEDPLLGYRPEQSKPVEKSGNPILKRPKKMRLNNEYPIILNEIFYPSAFNHLPEIPPKAEIYLETSYIHLGQRLYEEAFSNYLKAREFTDCKRHPALEFYFDMHGGQIFESAGKDEIAISFYHKAKEALHLMTSELQLKAFPYLSLGTCFFHLQQYELSLRCFEKAKQVLPMQVMQQIDSTEVALIQNNMGCCLMMLNRNQEATKYFDLSHNIYDLKVGRFDERCLVVMQNASKNKKAHLEMLPSFKTMWKTFVEKTNKPPLKGKPVKNSKK